MKKFLMALSVVFVPVTLFAQNANSGHLDSLVAEVIKLTNEAVGFLMILATLYFIWAVLKLIQADEKTRAEAKEKVKWAVIGLAIMVCVWGLIKFAASTLGLTDNTSAGLDIPCPPGQHAVTVSAGASGAGSIRVCQ